MKHLEFIAEGIAQPTAMKEILLRRGLSVTLLKKAKFGGIFLNGECVTVRASVKNGDIVRVVMPEGKSDGIVPMDIPIKTVYEDEYILALDKPTNMPTHPSRGNSLPTLANAVMGMYSGDFVFRSVNRLDRDTSGIVIIAKDQMTAHRLSASMKRGEFTKKYLCLVEGVPIPRSALIDAPIRREAEGSMKRIVASDGKRALSEYRVISDDGNRSLCEVKLYTGRTHQIRVHMAHIGHPLVSDYLYGKRSEKEYFLRCVEIELPHPYEDKIITIRG